MSVNNTVTLHKKTILLISSIVLILLATGTVFIVVHNNNKTTSLESSLTKKDTPTYQTLLPNGVSIDTLNGWTRISPAENDPVYAYTDTIKGVSISVSEQPTPASFQANLDTSVSELAKQYNATTELDAGTTKVHIGTSAKGPQSVIFVKNSLLVLIKSQQKIENNDWKKYIESLR